MALDDATLENFFNSPKINHGSNHLRVFDEPSDPFKKEKQKTQDKPKTNLGQSQDKVRTNLRQTQDKPRTQPKTQPKTNLGQSQDKPDLKTSFLSLIGLQRNILLFIYEVCHSTLDKKTPPLSIENISTSCKTSKSSAQKTIQRLEKKSVLIRSEYKNGRGGWTKYELPEHVFQDIFHNEMQTKLKTNLGQSQDKVETQPRTQPKTTLSSSSSILSNKLTTTGDQPKPEKTLPPEWSNLDIEPLNDFGFTETHLTQLADQNKLSPSVIQTSIYAFSFDLKENQKAKSIKGDPINYFMGILRNGRPYVPPNNYESPQARAMSLYVKRLEEVEKTRKEREETAFNLSFQNWFKNLLPNEKLSMIPKTFRSSKTVSEINLDNDQMLISFSRKYFKENVWINLREEILGENNVKKRN